MLCTTCPEASSETYSSVPKTDPWPLFMTGGVPRASKAPTRVGDDPARPHGARQVPRHYIAAAPVDHLSGAHVTAFYLRVGYVGAPDLVGKPNLLAPGQARTAP